MRIINEKNIIWLTKYNLDAIGYVFKYKNGLYRLIKKDKVQYVRELLSKGFIKKAQKIGFLPKTRIADELQIEGYEGCMILQHDQTPFLIIETEWTGEMFKDAFEFILKFELFLLREGYELYDPHPRNVGFYGTKPIYYDFGSIIKISTDDHYGSVRSIQTTWLYKYYLITKSRLSWESVQKLLLMPEITRDEYSRIRNDMCFLRTLKKIHGYWDRYIDTVLSEGEDYKEYKFINILVRIGRYGKTFDVCNVKKRKKKIINQYIRILRRSNYVRRDYRWSDYGTRNYADDDDLKIENRFKVYLEWLKDNKKEYGLVKGLEIGGNGGALGEVIVKKQILQDVCVSDYDCGAIDIGYHRCKNNVAVNRNLTFSNFNILKKDLDPNNNREKRLESDVVIMCAVSHHLLLSQKIRLERLVDILLSYTRKILVIEFMPLGLWDGSHQSQVPDWYNLEWFLDGLRSGFEILKVEQIYKNRVAIICKKLKLQ